MRLQVTGARQKEGAMSGRLGSRRVSVVILVFTLAVCAALSGGSAAAGAKKCGTVTLNEQAWAGSTANTYVAKNVLEKSLGCKVKITQITEIPVYQAMAN